MMQGVRVVDIQAQLAWQAHRDARSRMWVAYCQPLSLTAEGETWSELNQSIGEILNLLFMELLESNELDRFLLQHGWTLSVPVRDLRALPSGGFVFDIPFAVAQQAAHAAA